MRILSICPSIYPEKLSKMYDSYDVTTSRFNTLLIINQKGNITKLLNDTFEKHNNYDFYHLLNDDVLYESPLWDMELAQKGKISYGNDGLQENNLCTFPMIDGDIVRATGWLHMPTLNRYCGDVVWKFIGENLNILNYRADVKTTHKWDGCAEPEVNQSDMQAFANWLPYSFKDIEKIKKVLNG